MKYIFGPVPSRRLGMSLGVDIIPFKTCTFDCVYCQLGKTNVKTANRQAYVSKDDVLNELREVLDKENNRVDFITFSGSGEPTLNSEIGEMIRQIKSFTKVPIAVITNASLLWRHDVRQDLSAADLVVPSIDALVLETFEKVNRPEESLKLETFIEGLEKFTQEFRGKIWLEIMLVRNINDSFEELEQIADLIRKLKVDKIHLNTVIRPPAEDFALPISVDNMQKVSELFDNRVEIIADFDKIVNPKTDNKNDIENQIVALIKRRPCTVDDMSISLGIHRNEVIKYVNHLVDCGSIKRVKREDKWYYEK